MTDQQRADQVGYSPYCKGTLTPNIDTIAEYANFSCCQTTNPLCTPARTSLITGRYSRQIGTLTMAGDLFPQIPTFMQALQKAGYLTYGIGKFHYLQTYPWSTPRGCGMDAVAGASEQKRFGYDYIWETAGKQQLIGNYCFYGEYLNQKHLLSAVRDFYQECGGINGDTADHNYDKALPWPFDEEDYIDVVTGRMAVKYLTDYPAEKPFYMLVSFCGPHKPYDAPQRYLDMFPLERTDDFLLPDGQTLTEAEKDALYRQRRSANAMLRLIDDQIGMILDLLRKRELLEDTLILFTSDHGDMLGDHYMIQKGVPWRQAVNIPLAVKLPGAARMGAVSCPVELSDIAPTILEYAGLDFRETLSRAWPAYNDRLPCRSFLPVLQGKLARHREFCYCEGDYSEERHEDTDIREVLRKRGGNGHRSNAWQSIITEKDKYICYLDYEAGEVPYEEYYDLISDPLETRNRIQDPSCQIDIQLARRRRMYIMDHYPAAQMTWSTSCAASRNII